MIQFRLSTWWQRRGHCLALFFVCGFGHQSPDQQQKQAALQSDDVTDELPDEALEEEPQPESPETGAFVDLLLRSPKQSPNKSPKHSPRQPAFPPPPQLALPSRAAPVQEKAAESNIVQVWGDE